MLPRVLKIAFIGAGSVEFTRELLADMLALPGARGLDVALHDIDPERLETAEALARWTAEQLGRPPRSPRTPTAARRSTARTS